MRPRKKPSRYQASVRSVAKAARHFMDKIGEGNYQDNEIRAVCLNAACEIFRITTNATQQDLDRKQEHKLAMLDFKLREKEGE